MGGNFWRYRRRTERFESNGWHYKIRSYKDSLSCPTFPIALWFYKGFKRLSIDSTEQNKRLDTIENSIEQLAADFETIDDDHQDIDEALKNLKATDDIIKSDVTRDSLAKIRKF